MMISVGYIPDTLLLDGAPNLDVGNVVQPEPWESGLPTRVASFPPLKGNRFVPPDSQGSLQTMKFEATRVISLACGSLGLQNA